MNELLIAGRETISIEAKYKKQKEQITQLKNEIRTLKARVLKPTNRKKVNNLSFKDWKNVTIGFAEWIYHNAKAFPDGWHYKGNAVTTKELFDIFYKQG